MSDGISDEVVHFFKNWDEIGVLALENRCETIFETFVAVESLIEPQDAFMFALCICNRLLDLHMPETERQQMVEMFANTLPLIQMSSDDFRDTLDILMDYTSIYSANFAKHNIVGHYLDQLHVLVQDCVNQPSEKAVYTRPAVNPHLIRSANRRYMQ